MEFVREGNLIRFTNTNGITWDVWQKMLARINHLGYGLKDSDQLKDYFDRGSFLNEDQSIEVLKVLNNEHFDETLTPEDEKNRINKAALEHFGTTNEFENTGYIMTDGTLLNFSYMGYTRDTDHREIKDVMEDKDFDSNTEYMTYFQMLGNIRCMYMGIDLIKPPTKEQYLQIRLLIEDRVKKGYKDFSIDISNNSGFVIASFCYENAGTCFYRIKDDIENYFKSISLDEIKEEELEELEL